MAWRIELAGEAVKQFKKLDRADAKRIRDYLRQRVEPLENPRQLGKPLRGQLSELWRYRVGNFRIICELQDSTLVILVLRVGHRREVYDRT